MWHPITPSRKGSVKSVIRKSYKAAANKSWQSKKIQPHLQRKIFKELKKEVKVLQSSTTNSAFHQTKPIDVRSFSWKHLEGELQQRASFLYCILMSLTETRSSRSNRSAIIMCHCCCYFKIPLSKNESNSKGDILCTLCRSLF